MTPTERATWDLAVVTLEDVAEWLESIPAETTGRVNGMGIKATQALGVVKDCAAKMGSARYSRTTAPDSPAFPSHRADRAGGAA